MWGIAAYLDTESQVQKPLHIYTEQPKNVGESPLIFPTHSSL